MRCPERASAASMPDRLLRYIVVVRLYKASCVYGPDTNGWDDVDHLELATLSWVHWFN